MNCETPASRLCTPAHLHLYKEMKREKYEWTFNKVNHSRKSVTSGTGCSRLTSTNEDRGYDPPINNWCSEYTSTQDCHMQSEQG